MKTTTEKLKLRRSATREWCKSIMDAYAEHWSKDALVYKLLEQFYNTGLMKGHIYKSTSQPKKEEVLSSIAVAINEQYNIKLNENIVSKS